MNPRRDRAAERATAVAAAPPGAGRLRVTKKLAPDSRGALKLARQFGESLLCVRHRIDDHGEYRYTTVELLIDKARVQPRSDHVVGVRVEAHEKALQQLVRAAGGSWDYKARVWRLPRRVAGILRLTDRIAEK